MHTPAALRGLLLSTALLISTTLAVPAAAAASQKLSDLIGHPVITDSGEKLGTVEDFAINPTSGSLDFVVISIGSFLVEKSLIAVQPEALAPAASGDPLVLKLEDLEVAHRFNADNWPSSADVRSAKAKVANDSDTDSDAASTSAPLSATGTATITAGSKKATWEDGKRELVNGPIRRAKPAQQPAKSSAKNVPVVANFKNLDLNRDGRLSLAELDAQPSQNSGFKDMDIDANGSIDDFEFEAYQQRLAQERRWARNR